MNEIVESKLEKLAAQIEDGLIIAAKGFLQIGEALVAAKLEIDDDNRFGEWRRDNTSIKSTRTASAYMQVYRRFATSKLTGKVPYSVLQELVSAPDDAVEQIENKVDNDENITVKETREIVKDAKANEKDGSLQEESETETEETGDSEVLQIDEPKRTVRTTGDIIAEADGVEKQPTVPSWLTEEQAMLALPELKRIKTAGICWHILGLSAYFETMPSKDSINHLCHALVKAYEATDQEAEDAIRTAWGRAMEEIEQ